MTLLPLLVQHGLALFLCALACRSVTLHYGDRSNRATRGWRLRSYWKTIGWQWFAVGILLLTTPLAELVYLRGHSPRSVSLHALSFILTANIVVLLYGPIALAWLSPRIRRGVLAPFAPIRALLPVTLPERGLWLLLSLTTGICEELMFRAFAINYLTGRAFGLNLLLSALVACLVFGVGHAYQGMRGLVRTTAFGAALTGLFLVTGSIMLPIVVHTLVNLRVAFLPSGRMPTRLINTTAHDAPQLQLSDA